MSYVERLCMYFPGAETSYHREQKQMEVPRFFWAPYPGREILGAFLNVVPYPVPLAVPCLTLVVVHHFSYIPSVPHASKPPHLNWTRTVPLSLRFLTMMTVWPLEFYFGQKVTHPFLPSPNHSEITFCLLPSPLFSHVGNKPLLLWVYVLRFGDGGWQRVNQTNWAFTKFDPFLNHKLKFVHTNFSSGLSCFRVAQHACSPSVVICTKLNSGDLANSRQKFSRGVSKKPVFPLCLGNTCSQAYEGRVKYIFFKMHCYKNHLDAPTVRRLWLGKEISYPVKLHSRRRALVLATTKRSISMSHT